MRAACKNIELGTINRSQSSEDNFDSLNFGNFQGAAIDNETIIERSHGLGLSE